MYGVAQISRLLKFLCFFAKESHTRDDILQKRSIIVRSLLIVATPYLDTNTLDPSHVLQHTATNCDDTLLHTAKHCKTLQHSAAHCKMLQHAEACCSMLLCAAISHASDFVAHTNTYTHTHTLAHTHQTISYLNKDKGDTKTIHMDLCVTRAWGQIDENGSRYLLGVCVRMCMCVCVCVCVWVCVCVCMCARVV